MATPSAPQFIYYPIVTRNPFRYPGRIIDLITSRKLFADIGLPALESEHDRVMICGSPALVADTRVLLTEGGALSRAITARRRSSWSKRLLRSAEFSQALRHPPGVMAGPWPAPGRRCRSLVQGLCVTAGTSWP